MAGSQGPHWPLKRGYGSISLEKADFSGTSDLGQVFRGGRVAQCSGSRVTRTRMRESAELTRCGRAEESPY